MLVRDILRQKGSDVVTIGPDRTVHDAILLLNKHGIGGLLVVGEGGEILGIVTERDIMRECGKRGVLLDPPAGRPAGPSPCLVQHVMSSDLVIGVPADTLEYVMGVMTKNRIRHLPILDEGKLAGIISIGDVVHALLKETEFENRMLKDYIRGDVR